MSKPYLSDQSFIQLISDAIYFYKASVKTEDKYETHRFSRASILNSTLTLEAAANCCLYHIDGSNKFINEMEKTTSFAKFDVFAKFHKNKFIDRGCHKFQQVAELKKVRDSFVHPKKIKIPVDFSIDERKYKDFTELGISFEGNPHPTTKIDKSSMFWFSNDAKSALTAIFSFYDYYFIELLEIEHKEILGLLGNAIFTDNKSCWVFHPQSLENDLYYLDNMGIKQNFIELKSVPIINTVNPEHLEETSKKNP